MQIFRIEHVTPASKRLRQGCHKCSTASDLFVQGHEPDFKGRIHGHVVGLKFVEDIELIFSDMQGLMAGSSSSLGQREAQLHNENARKQVAVQCGGLVSDYVGQHNVDALA